MRVQLVIIPCPPGLHQPVETLLKPSHPVLLARGNIPLRLLHVQFPLELTMQVLRRDVELDDVEVTYGGEGEQGT